MGIYFMRFFILFLYIFAINNEVKTVLGGLFMNKVNKRIRRCMAFMAAIALLICGCFVGAISASASPIFPKLNGSNYVICYLTSDNSAIPVYGNSGLSRRGASSSYNGSVTWYNASINGRSDEVRVYKIYNNSAYVRYPAGNTYKYGFISRSYVTTWNEGGESFTAKAKVNTYEKSNLSVYFGYIAVNDKCCVVSKSGDKYQLAYPVSNNNWKLGWVSTNDYKKLKGISDPEPTVFLQTDSRWKNVPYGYSNAAGTTRAYLNGSGCGILSYVNAVYYLNGKFIQPETLANWSLRNGYRKNGVGTDGGLYSAFANSQGKYYGFKYTRRTSNYTILSKFIQSSDYVAIGSQADHLMAVVNYNPNTGKFLILDSSPSSNRGTNGSKHYVWKTATECQNNYYFRFNTFYIIQKT